MTSTRAAEAAESTGNMPRLRWWREALALGLFYAIYSFTRNQFGSAAVDESVAHDNAIVVIDIERALGLYIEADVQDLFIDWTAFIQFWNLFYGTFHFVVTAFALIFLYRRFPIDYPRWRNSGLVTTALGLVGFSLFPLMPPRLLGDCGEFGACIADSPYIDTVSEIGGLWSFDSGTAQKLSNQFAAMPSLHFGWSMWCALALYPRLRHPAARIAIAAYPALTLFAIVVTANHYWLDAVGALAVLAVGLVVADRIERRRGSGPIWPRASRRGLSRSTVAE
ncbi:MAG: phosphatase PAP2 family protein [Acidimicrobiia bacterium]|nr:phosphatase PAP2 family protein [Acidimicrobiia bacterium]